jgi:lipopolysaccharide/colanic/teichoic acid biosynthesis glycosyltransferase
MIKRLFDFFFALLAFTFLGIFIFFFWILASIDTKSNGLFIQKRIGQFGKEFDIFKLKSIQNNCETISKFGKFIRKYKIDELPQLLNIFIGNMSFVGPRPDVAGYYDKLEGENRIILNLKPGLTSLASIKYANEDEILSQQPFPLHYNDEIIFPDKVKMNLEYYKNQSLLLDLKIIIKTILR